jgi:hypothetical protein
MLVHWFTLILALLVYLITPQDQDNRCCFTPEQRWIESIIKINDYSQLWPLSRWIQKLFRFTTVKNIKTENVLFRLLDLASIVFLTNYIGSILLSIYLRPELSIISVMWLAMVPFLCILLDVHGSMFLITSSITMFSSIVVLARLSFYPIENILPMVHMCQICGVLFALFMAITCDEVSKSLEQYRSRTIGLIQQAQRASQAKDNFLACVSHELRYFTEPHTHSIAISINLNISLKNNTTNLYHFKYAFVSFHYKYKYTFH